MARETRAATGNSKPRIFPTVCVLPHRQDSQLSSTQITETDTTRKTTTKKPSAKANTTAKRAPAKKATTTGKKPVGVKKTPAKGHKTSIGTKIKGVGKKIVGEIEGNPEKKAAGTKKIVSSKHPL